MSGFKHRFLEELRRPCTKNFNLSVQMEMEQWRLSSLKPDILFVNIIAQTSRDSLNTISKSVQYPVEEKFEHPIVFIPFLMLDLISI